MRRNPNSSDNGWLAIGLLALLLAAYGVASDRPPLDSSSHSDAETHTQQQERP